MNARILTQLARMDSAEAAWRARTTARSWWDRARTSVREPRWRRRALAPALDASPSLDSARQALKNGRDLDAHRALAAHIARRPSRFLVGVTQGDAVASRILAAVPGARDDARRRADPLLRGEHDLLGYSGLRFADDWHFDPVHDRRAPRAFWAAVPYLDPACGDHKVIWELNRHQHWLALGRADWLTGEPQYRERCLAELASWMAANPPLVGINWASMLELAFRSLSWTWALHMFGANADADAEPWIVDLLLGLDAQLAHIESNLSYYFSPNTHLIGEALALYVAGAALPELAASRRRQDVGRRILVAELSKQVARDGGHCERSTHYHRYTLDFYLLALAIARIARDPIAAVFDSAVRRLASAARALADDSGRLPHLGDDDGGMLLPIAGRQPDDIGDSLTIAGLLVGQADLRIEPAPEEAFWFLAHPSLAGRLAAGPPASPPAALTSTCLPETGYYVSRSAGAHLVIDGGPHGYKNGGHAHADALSLTLSVHGLPLLIDPGTGSYTGNATLRDRFRSTASHNTVVVDDRWQSVPSGPFHWTTAAAATVHRWRTAGVFDYFDGSHHGYAPVEHRRRVLALHGDAVVVADLVSGPDSHAVDVNWHLDPRWHAAVRGRSATLVCGAVTIGLVVPHGSLSITSGDEDAGLGWHSPVYGRVEPTTTIQCRQTGKTPIWAVSVFDLNPIDPIVDVEWLPVWVEAGALAHSAAVKISRAESTSYVAFSEPSSAGGRVTWRVGEFETDARMMCCRVLRSGQMDGLALVDGAIVRSGSGRRAFAVALGRVTPALHIDASNIRNFTPCAASPGS
jgi:uncharacterized heparinase superfamily protein